MFKIAICDDNEAVCKEIEEILENFLLAEQIACVIDSFKTGEELLKELEYEEGYDLIYLDIELEEVNGVAVGRYIREKMYDDFTQIAFVSAKTSYAMELFQVRPITFLVKPLKPDEVAGVLKKTLELQGRQTGIFSYKISKSENKVPYKDIMYFSSDAKKIIIHKMNSEDYFYGKLSDLRLPSADFIQIHKSFIVNKQFVTRFKFDSIILSNGEELPISRAYRKNVRENLMRQ